MSVGLQEQSTAAVTDPQARGETLAREEHGAGRRPARLTVTREPIESLQAVWTTLLQQTRTRNVFLTWGFLVTWWSHFARQRELRCFVVRHDAKPVAIVPLCLERRRGRFGTWRVLRNVGFGDVVNPDFLDALVLPGWEDQVADALAPELLADRGWQFAEFGELDPDGSLVRIAQRLAHHHGLSLRVEQRSICPFIPLPGSFDQFLAARNSHFRQQLRRYRRVIERELEVEWRRVGIDLTVDEGIEALTVLHQERMEATERGGNFKKGDYQAFHRDLAGRLAASGELYFWVLFSRGEAIATHYGFLYGTTYYGYQMGFTHRHHKYSPGHYMTGVVIEKLIGLGAQEMNLLRGTDGWKFRWTDVTRQTVNAMLLRPGLSSQWAHVRAGLSQPPALALRFLIGRDSFEELRSSLQALRDPASSERS